MSRLPGAAPSPRRAQSLGGNDPRARRGDAPELTPELKYAPPITIGRDQRISLAIDGDMLRVQSGILTIDIAALGSALRAAGYDL